MRLLFSIYNQLFGKLFLWLFSGHLGFWFWFVIYLWPSMSYGTVYPIINRVVIFCGGLVGMERNIKLVSHKSATPVPLFLIVKERKFLHFV